MVVLKEREYLELRMAINDILEEYEFAELDVLTFLMKFLEERIVSYFKVKESDKYN